MDAARRKFVAVAGAAGGSIFLGQKVLAVVEPQPSEPAKPQDAKQQEVTAVEDLMREHGILRRALFVYSEAADKLRKTPFDVSPQALQKTAKLFRAFGEDYHEKKLEEAYIFPEIKKTGGEAAGYTGILIEQHNRGREITNYIIDSTREAKFDATSGKALAGILDSMVRMYTPHAAREDTVIFPAWKQMIASGQMDEMSEKFEEIEHQMLGEHGFENAVRQISEIENELGIANLSQFTAPPIIKNK